MPACDSVYQPREDSTLLEKHVRVLAKGVVLDVGTGSGIQALTAALRPEVSRVIAVDIQEEVIEHCREHVRNRKIEFFQSDLFSIFKKNPKLKKIKFDTIIFNPPYLPQELKVKDLSLEGGKKGYETVERFLDGVNGFLKKDGIILLLFSSLTKKEKVEEFIRNNLLELKLLEEQNIFFEQLFVYEIGKSELLKRLEKKGIREVHYFSRGKRGFIFTGFLKGKKIAIKTNNPESKAVSRIENEANFLKALNKRGIGPKFLLSDVDFVVREFIDGKLIEQYLEINDKKDIIKIINKIFLQLFEMDRLNINKEEMSHPHKHIIIDKKGKPYLIDFERCRKTIKPGNVTQFCDYLIGGSISGVLMGRGITINKEKMILSSKRYKKSISKENLKKIIKTIE